MKQLTALLTAALLLFSLPAAAWAEDAASAAEPAPAVQTAPPSDSIPSGAVEPVPDVQAAPPSDSVPSGVVESVPALLTSPDAPAGGYINPEGETVSENQNGVVMNINDGTVGTNRGTVEVNNGTVDVNAMSGTVITNNGTVGLTTNNGIVVTNNGTVPRNSPYGTVTENNGTITTNAGTLETNTKAGTVTTNEGTVGTNAGSVQTNEGTVETNNGNVETNAQSGIVKNNYYSGRIKTNNGTVENNKGTVNNNYGTVETNASLATIEANRGIVEMNDGFVFDNFETVEINNETININRATIVVNNGVVTNVYCGTHPPEITFNLGEVQYSDTPEEVKYNAGKVFLNPFTSYGVVYANEAGEGSLLPQGVAEQILANVQNAEGILEGLVSNGDLVFTAAEYDTGDPAKNGELTFLTEADVSFANPGYTLSGWLDANNDNLEYALGQTVTVTAPLWLIPNWVLIPVTPPPTTSVPESSAASAPQAEEAGTYYLLVPAAAVQTQAWDLTNVSVTSSDPRVTKDSALPAAALRLSADLAGVIRTWPFQIEFDGEFLPTGSYSLSFHQDGTVTLLLSRTFLSTVAAGEHEITLYLHDAAIDVTILLTEPEPEETSLRARKAQLSGAFTNMPQSSAAGQKGKSG